MSDAEDAGRYRWLKAQFERKVERREHDALVSEKGNRRTYETVVDYGISFELRDDWRFGRYGAKDDLLDFDALVDELMASYDPKTPDELKKERKVSV